MSENHKISKSSVTVIYEWRCPNCNTTHNAFDWDPMKEATIYCVKCHVVIDVVDEI